ncbi:hypothetical protein CCH79_00007368 [Gambusia affinis]|uniref:LRRNT domain-containing protein n=1 Tax=Gambusia affinis TaxID=33528 RepID=A0A315VF04_GAMAF|nr:hypothetical protein CCH79_00007368 [Gambusia affinis]
MAAPDLSSFKMERCLCLQPPQPPYKHSSRFWALNRIYLGDDDLPQNRLSFLRQTVQDESRLSPGTTSGNSSLKFTCSCSHLLVHPPMDHQSSITEQPPASVIPASLRFERVYGEEEEEGGAQWGELSGRQSISTAQQSAAVTPGKDAPISEERWDKVSPVTFCYNASWRRAGVLCPREKERLDRNTRQAVRQRRLDSQRRLLSSLPAPQTHAGCPGSAAGECWSSSARVHDALGGLVMRFLPEPSAHSLRLLFLFIFVMGVAPSPALTAGCPDGCVCDDQLVVQCAGQDLTLFPNDLPLATRQLILSNNRIADLPPLQLNYLSDLVYLDCSNNSLTEISESTFGNLRKLAYLDLSFNTLLQIEDRTFGPLASLVMLRLTDNPNLGEIHPDAFSENFALQVLDVSRNNLTVLNISSLIALPALRSLGLSGNPWRCDCDTEDLCLWVQIEGFKFQADVFIKDNSVPIGSLRAESLFKGR